MKRCCRRAGQSTAICLFSGYLLNAWCPVTRNDGSTNVFSVWTKFLYCTSDAVNVLVMVNPATVDKPLTNFPSAFDKLIYPATEFISHSCPKTMFREGRITAFNSHSRVSGPIPQIFDLLRRLRLAEPAKVVHAFACALLQHGDVRLLFLRGGVCSRRPL